MSTLVAGVGNIFKRDDGFGSTVVQWLEQHHPEDWPEGALVKDFGIAGIHLAYELLDGYDELVLVDTMHRAGEPGTLYVVEPDLSQVRASSGSMVDAHDMAPESVLALVPALGGELGHVTVVGVEPVSVEDGMGLSAMVAERVPEAARLVTQVVCAGPTTIPTASAEGFPPARTRGTVRR